MVFAPSRKAGAKIRDDRSPGDWLSQFDCRKRVEHDIDIAHLAEGICQLIDIDLDPLARLAWDADREVCEGHPKSSGGHSHVVDRLDITL
jgi:hypothetical protein